MIQSVRHREIVRSEKDLESTVRLFAKQFDKHLEAFEAVPKSVAKFLANRADTADQFRELAGSADINRLLKDKVSDSADFAGVNLFDSDGKFVNSSERWPVPMIDLSDRWFFRSFKDGSSKSPLFIQFVESRLNTGLTIVLARRIESQDASFLGMVTRSISPQAFESFFATLLIEDGMLALVHRDGSLLARYPHAAEKAGRSLLDSPLIQQTAIDGYATMSVVSPIDNSERLMSARSLEHYPIYVIAGKSNSAIVASWEQETRTFGAAAALAATIVSIMLAGHRQAS